MDTLTRTATAAKWYAANSTASTDVLIRLEGEMLVIESEGRKRSFNREKLKISSRITGIPLKVTLENGTWLQIADGEFAVELSGRRGNMLAWMESRLLHLLPLILVLLAGIYLLMSKIVLPSAGDWFASKIPISTVVSWEDEFWEDSGNYYFKTIGQYPGYVDEKAKIESVGATMSAAAGGKFPLSFTLIDGPPNAMALPGGRILATAKLVRLLSEEELAAVLGHEIGHVERRHSLQSLGRSVLWSLFTLATGSIDVVNLTALLTEFSYSRKQENEADCFGAAVLAKVGMDTTAMGSALASLEKYYKSHMKEADKKRDGEPEKNGIEPDADNQGTEQVLTGLAEIIMTHPNLENRMQNLQSCDRDILNTQ